MLDRRKFFKLFSAGAAGLTVAGKLALAEDIKDWMLSPQKTIFIPPPAKVIVPQFKKYVIKLEIAGEKDGFLSPMRYTWVPADGTPEVMADVEKAAQLAYEAHGYK